MTEDKVEQAALKILEGLGFQVLHGPEIGPDGSTERQYMDAVLADRLIRAVARINPNVPETARTEAMKRVIRSVSPDLVHENRDFHQLLVNGVDVEYRSDKSDIRTGKVWLVDWDNPTNNEFVAVNQYTFLQGDYHRRPDVVLFVNGLPLGIVELKDPTGENATVKSAFRQLQTYKAEIPALFRFNELMIISDGIDAEIGTLSADFERFTPWKTIEGDKEHAGVPMLEVLLRGVCEPARLLDIVRNYIVFEKTGKENYIKKLAAYHQYWAVRKALEKTAEASGPRGDHRAGVVWHTQGSGKSLSMVFYAGKLAVQSELANPTIVVVTDRNDLDDQLFETFGNSVDLLRQTPVQATSSKHLKELLKVASGGIVFTTNAKFFPEEGQSEHPLLSDRRNIVVIADEAHRSQYNFIDGFAKHIRDALPNASFIGFTGTPIEADDRSTPAVFGDYIDVYDIQQAVADGATVPIYYESRLVELNIEKDMREQIDADFEALTEGEEVSRREELKAKWAQAEAIVGNGKRIARVAEDLVAHFEARREVMEGKGMVVTMSRRIAIELYNQIVKLRPHWHGEKDDQGFVKVVMTGSASDPVEWQQHIRNKERRKDLALRMKDADSSLKLIIVCDMWLTGFDAPSLHTMYLDKPMKGHNLMQAIARINRVYKDKPGGLVVDYLGVAAALREALGTYTVNGGKGRPTLDQAEAVAVMKEKFEICQTLFHGFDYVRYFSADTNRQLQILLDAQEFILAQDDGEKRLRQHVLELSMAFALAVPHQDALEIREYVAFFQAVKARLAKISERGERGEDLSLAIRQIVDKAIAPAGVVDVFAVAGLEKRDISVLSEEFLAEIRNSSRPNLAVEALQKLLNDEIRARFAKNAVKTRSFAQMLEEALKKYHNKTIEAAKVIEELIEIARKMKDDLDEMDKSGLSADEIAFYDALAAHGTASAVMGDDKLRELARLLVQRVRGNVTVDWTIRENAQARLRVEVKRLLRQFGYPPDEEKLATVQVLEQASLFAGDWAKESK